MDGFALRQCVEYGVRFLADGAIGGHQAEVGIQTGGLFVVVARSNLRVICYAFLLAAGNQAELECTL